MTDAGFDSSVLSAERLVQSQQAQLDLVGPTTPEPGWQAKAKQGVAASCFVRDWETQQATSLRLLLTGTLPDNS